MKKKKLKSLRSLKAKAWELFSKMVRQSFANSTGFSECYTCGTRLEWWWLQCGHAIGGRTNAVLFDAEICRPQCARCNVFLRGNYPIFTAKLIRENGLEWFEKKLEGARRIVKYTRADIEQLIETYKRKVA